MRGQGKLLKSVKNDIWSIGQALKSWPTQELVASPHSSSHLSTFIFCQYSPYLFTFLHSLNSAEGCYQKEPKFILLENEIGSRVQSSPNVCKSFINGSKHPSLVNSNQKTKRIFLYKTTNSYFAHSFG